MTTRTVYLGYDSREDAAWWVAQYSILRRTDPDQVEIFSLGGKVPTILDRPVERRDGKLWCPISQAPMATEFAISRFCVPFLSSAGQWALFLDSDIVCLADIAKLFALADDRYAVMVVKHDHQPVAMTKMDGQAQTCYPRKNWSSVCLWNKEHPGTKRFTREMLNTWPGRDLHAFKWLKDEEIGSLSGYWNHLVGVAPSEKHFDPSHSPGTGVLGILHYTMGGPWLPGWEGGPLDYIWLAEKESYDHATHPVNHPEAVGSHP